MSAPQPVAAAAEVAAAPQQQVAAPAGPTSGYAIVKSVISGDQLVLVGKAAPGEVAPEKRVILADIQTPRLARGRDKEDEPWAWHAREFLRRKVIGSQVAFIITPQNQPQGGAENAAAGGSGRDYAIVRFNNEDLAQSIVAAGWAEVKLPPLLQKSVDEQLKADPSGASVVFPPHAPVHLAALWEFQRRAKAAGIGRWTKLPADTDMSLFVRQINFRPDAMDLFDKCRNIPLPAQVEKVLDAGRLRVLVTVPLPGQNPRQQHPLAIPPQTSFILQLAGLQAPEIPNTPPGGGKRKAKLPPFAELAADYVSRLLLDRSIHVVLQAVDKRNGLYGTVQFPRGNISVKLLEQGYARMVPWSAILTGFENAKILDAAQQQGVLARRGVWGLEKVQARLASGVRYTGLESVMAATAGDPNAWRVFQIAPPRYGEVLVTEVRSGDRLVVQDLQRVFVGPLPEAGAEEGGKAAAAVSDRIEVALASIRAPRIGRQGAELVQDLAPYAWQARDWLRRRLIGQNVRAVLEYCGSGNPQENNDSRLHVSLYDLKTNFNFSAGLVGEGLATVVNHSSFEPRCGQYLNLLQVERIARSQKLGVHGLPEPVAEKAADKAEEKQAAEKPADKDNKAEVKSKDSKDAGKKQKEQPAAAAAAAEPKKAGNGKKAAVGGAKLLPGQIRITDLTLQVGGRPNRRKDKKDKAAEPKAELAPAALQSEIHQKLKALVDQLRGDKKHPAMVERVFSATRFKVFLYKQNTFVTVLLAGIRLAQNPHAEVALNLSRDLLTQRDCRVQIVDMDQYDNVYAVLHLDQTNWAEKLVAEGLATVIPPSAARLQCGAELVAAQKAAQAAQLNVWTGYDEEAERAKKQAEREARLAAANGGSAAAEAQNPSGALVAGSSRIPVQITEIVDPTHFFVRVQDEEAQAEQIKNQIDEWLAAEAQEAAAGAEEKPAWKPERNGVCLGLFAADGQWYRVKVEAVPSARDPEDAKLYQVLFLDYGGYAALPLDKLRPLDPALQKLPATTHLCVLAGVKGPGRISGVQAAAAERFNELTLDQTTSARVELVTSKLAHLSLYVGGEAPAVSTTAAAEAAPAEDQKNDDAEDQDAEAETAPESPVAAAAPSKDEAELKSVQETLLEQGWLRVLSKPPRELKDLVKGLRQFEAVAKRRRLVLWKVGDVSSSDEESLQDLVAPPQSGDSAAQQ